MLRVRWPRRLGKIAKPAVGSPTANATRPPRPIVARSSRRLRGNRSSLANGSWSGRRCGGLGARGVAVAAHPETGRDGGDPGAERSDHQRADDQPDQQDSNPERHRDRPDLSLLRLFLARPSVDPDRHDRRRNQIDQPRAARAQPLSAVRHHRHLSVLLLARGWRERHPLPQAGHPRCGRRDGLVLTRRLSLESREPVGSAGERGGLGLNRRRQEHRRAKR